MTLEEEYRLSCYEELTTLGNHKNIYLVKNKLSGRIFVKKILSRFSLDVYQQLNKMNLSGVPDIHEMIVDHDSLILIEDYIHGQTLEQLLMEKKTLSKSDSYEIMLKLCDILKKLHHLNPPVIHRDLKLSNIILTSEGLVYIVDFDTARYYEPGQTQDTELLGTKEYASPEQYGFRQSDTRSDIYALGVIFNRLLTGNYPKYQLADGKYRRVISKCIRWEPEDRFQTIEEFENALIHPEILRGRFSPVAFIAGLPGFRTKKLWKMLLALIGYAYCFYGSLTMDFYLANGNPLSPARLWYERIYMLLILLFLIFFNCNYKNLRTHLFLGHSFPFWKRVIAQIVLSCIFLIVMMTLAMTIEETIW